MDMSKYNFKYQIGKLYRYNGTEEKIFHFDKPDCYPRIISIITNGDIICFLTEPRKKSHFHYCKVLHGDGSIGEMIWDENTCDIFLIVAK